MYIAELVPWSEQKGVRWSSFKDAKIYTYVLDDLMFWKDIQHAKVLQYDLKSLQSYNSPPPHFSFVFTVRKH